MGKVVALDSNEQPLTESNEVKVQFRDWCVDSDVYPNDEGIYVNGYTTD